MINRTFFLDRDELSRAFGNPTIVRKFEEMQESVAASAQVSTAVIEATEAQRDATYITLSANAELPNERVLAVAPGLSLDTNADGLVVLQSNVFSDNGWPVQLNASGATVLQLPTAGFVATRGGQETLTNKTLDAPSLSGLVNAVDDAAAASANVPVGGVYRNGNALLIRLV